MSNNNTQPIERNEILRDRIETYLRDTLDTPLDLVNTLIVIKMMQNEDFAAMEFIEKGMANLSSEEYIEEIFSNGFSKELSLLLSLNERDRFPLANLAALEKGDSHE
jgi:hypothetical protein